MDTTTVTFVWLALCCCCYSSFAVPVSDRRLRQTDRVSGNPATPDRVASDAATSDQPFDPTLDALADAKYDESEDDNNNKNRGTEDREKRQLSFVQGKLLNFLKVRRARNITIIIITLIIIYDTMFDDGYLRL